MTDATELDTAAIRARLEAATPGPWEVGDGWVYTPPVYEDDNRLSDVLGMKFADLDRQQQERARAQANAEFIAHARTDVERLLDAVASFAEQLEAERHDHERTRAALDETRAERDKAQRAAKTLGSIVEQNARMILDITGLHDWIDEDGDGDWGAVWDNAYELLPRIKTTEAQVELLHFNLDREAHARQAAESALAAVEQERDKARAEQKQLLRALPHDWREQYERARRAEAKVEAVESLHADAGDGWCTECSVSPCRTRAALATPTTTDTTTQGEADA